MNVATVLVPLVVVVVGALAYALAGNPKLSEMGRLLFFVGILWLVYLLSGRAVRS